MMIVIPNTGAKPVLCSPSVSLSLFGSEIYLDEFGLVGSYDSEEKAKSMLRKAYNSFFQFKTKFDFR